MLSRVTHFFQRLARAAAALACAIVCACLWAAPAQAANCNVATSQGATGPANWQTYCWLDLSSYSDTTARSTSGQNFTYNLPDGTTMTFNMRVTAGPVLDAVASPSWSGAAVGNTAFLGIAGQPILYQTTDGGSSSITIRNIVLTPPPGSGAITAYMFVAADAESSNGGETLSFQTNGGNWQLLDQVGPTSGSTYPTYTGVGNNTFAVTGVGGTVGAYIVGSTTPTQVVTTMTGAGLQGAMFAVRFASIRLNMQIQGGRVAAADQFKFDITSTSGGGVLATGTSTGSGTGPFAAASLTTASALPVTLSQAMAAGSTNTISHYRSVLTCTNSSVSSTPLPNNVVTTSYSFGALQFGDNVSCNFTAAAYPHLRLTKTLPSGRRFTSDQFILNIMNGASVVATTTTTGSNSTVNNGSTPQYQGVAGTTYTLAEVGAGTTSLTQYTAAMTCTNTWTGSSTVLPNDPGETVTPQDGDVISCTIANTRLGNNATLSLTKTSQVLSDPFRGTVNPLAIPGAIVRYTFAVSNTGNSPVDSGSVVLIDAVPSQVEVGTGANPLFTQGTPTSGLQFTVGTDLRYSSAASPPANFAACTYTPTGTYDPNVRYVCFNPKNAMAARTSSNPAPNFTLSFDARVK
ncbi:MAG TPA: hypothetical protein VI168_10255 [Croceibacterium sp.]